MKDIIIPAQTHRVSSQARVLEGKGMYINISTLRAVLKDVATEMLHEFHYGDEIKNKKGIKGVYIAPALYAKEQSYVSIDSVVSLTLWRNDSFEYCPND